MSPNQTIARITQTKVIDKDFTNLNDLIIAVAKRARCESKVCKFLNDNNVLLALSTIKESAANFREYQRLLMAERVKNPILKAKHKESARVAMRAHNQRVNALLGNKCIFTGSTENLEKHHVVPHLKAGDPSQYPTNQKELDKCILLTRHAHRTLHRKLNERIRQIGETPNDPNFYITFTTGIMAWYQFNFPDSIIEKTTVKDLMNFKALSNEFYDSL